MSRRSLTANRSRFLSRKKFLSAKRQSRLEKLEMRAAPGDFLGGLGVMAIAGMWDDVGAEGLDLVPDERDDADFDDYWSDRELLSIAPTQGAAQGGGAASDSDWSDTAQAGKGGGFGGFGVA